MGATDAPTLVKAFQNSSSLNAGGELYSVFKCAAELVMGVNSRKRDVFRTASGVDGDCLGFEVAMQRLIK